MTGRRALYRLAQLTWGAPQSLAGAALTLRCRRCPRENFHGAVLTRWPRKASLSLGLFLFVTDDPFYHYPAERKNYTDAAFSRRLAVHEYGHSIQSLLLGPLYLPAVGLPSLLWSFLPSLAKKREREHLSYFSVWPERQANDLGELFTGEASVGQPL